MQNRTSWTHQFASGSSIAACSWLHAQDNIPCPLCVNVTILLPGLIWQLIQNHPSGSGVNTGGANLSAAGSVDRLSKHLSGTRVGTWDAKSPPQAFYPEGNTCLSRGENILFKRLVQVSGTNSHRKRNVENPPATHVVLPITRRSSNPLFRWIHPAHLSLSSATPPPQNCYPNAMICMEYLSPCREINCI